jgi:glycosyltransferase involved in cell wall biosynthesis
MNALPPLVSIIIPVYNSEPFLRSSIENALQQTWSNKEIIIVDDGSTDASLSIAKSYEGESVKVIGIANGGAAKARNIGFRHTRGEYIQYLDADDLMVNNKIELQMRRLLQEPKPQQAVCAGQWLRFNTSIEDIQGGVGPGPQAEYDMPPLEWLVLRPYNLMTVHAWLTPRMLIEKAGPWNETMTLDDDGEFFMRVVNASDKVLSCQGALTYYRTLAHQSTLSHHTIFQDSAGNCDKLKSAFKSLETYRKILNKYGGRGIKSALGRNFLFMAFNSYLVCDEVFEKCRQATELPFFQRFVIYKSMKGKFGLLALMVGWQNMKKVMMRSKEREA